MNERNLKCENAKMLNGKRYLMESQDKQLQIQILFQILTQIFQIYINSRYHF